MIKINVNGETVEVKPDDLQMPEGFGLITPDSVPEGYYTEEAVQKRIQDRLKNTAKNAREDALKDESVHKQILNEYNVSLDENGKVKGLKHDFDVDEWKKTKAKELTEPYEEKLSAKEKELNKFKNGLVRAEILKAASGKFKDEFVKSFTGSDDPFVVKQFGDVFDVDESGNVAMKDTDGTFAVTGDGSRITPDKYFENNKDKFKSMLKDNRQAGSGFKGGANGSPRTFSEEEISKMSDEEYAKHREDILKSIND